MWAKYPVSTLIYFRVVNQQSFATTISELTIEVKTSDGWQKVCDRPQQLLDHLLREPDKHRRAKMTNQTFPPKARLNSGKYTDGGLTCFLPFLGARATLPITLRPNTISRRALKDHTLY